MGVGQEIEFSTYGWPRKWGWVTGPRVKRALDTMSMAAIELEEPPTAIRQAKLVLCLQVLAAISYVVASINRASTQAALFLIGEWCLHLSACGLVGRAATQMGRKWWRYSLYPITAPFAGPCVFFALSAKVERFSAMMPNPASSGRIATSGHASVMR
jgi:hypothetical protein